MKKARILVVLVILICSGCVNIGYSYRVNPHPDEKLRPDYAFVLLAIAGKYDVSSVNGRNGDGDNVSYSFYVAEHDGPISSVVALRFKAGESFSINTVKFELLKGSRYSQGKRYILDVKKPKIMRFPEPKIYYYGMVVSNGKRASIVYNNKEKVLAIAKIKFPRIFSTYPIADK